MVDNSKLGVVPVPVAMTRFIVQPDARAISAENIETNTSELDAR